MNDYQPLTPQEVAKGYLWLKYRPLIKKIIFGGGIFLVGGVYVILVLGLIKYFGQTSFEATAANLMVGPDWQAIHRQTQPQPVVASGAQFLSIGPRRYNLVAFINNPNNNWGVTNFKYKFVVNGQDLDQLTGFINPGENRLLLQIGYEAKQPLTDLKVVISDFKWQRLFSDFSAPSFPISQVKFTPLIKEEVAGEQVEFKPRVSWQAQNLSLNDYWEVDWQVALFNGDILVGVNNLKVKDWPALQSKDLEVVWLNDLPRVTRTEIYPLLNWFDSYNIKPLSNNTAAENL
jgi:hypothetical protein